MGNKTNPQDAIVDMVKALKPVLKKYSRHTRTEAWKKLSDKRGDREMQKILVDPDRPINTFKQLAFKEWLEESVIKTSSRIVKTEEGRSTLVDFKIFRNPTYEEMIDTLKREQQILEVQGFKFKTHPRIRGSLAQEDIYIWPEHGAMHYQIAKEIGLSGRLDFYIDQELNLDAGYTATEHEIKTIQENPHFQKMIRGGKTTTSSVVKIDWKAALKPKPGAFLPLNPESTQLS